MLQWKCPKSRAGGYRRTHGRGCHSSHPALQERTVTAVMRKSSTRRYSVPTPHPRHEELIEAIDRAWWLSFLRSTRSEKVRMLEAYASTHDEVGVEPSNV